MTFSKANIFEKTRSDAIPGILTFRYAVHTHLAKHLSGLKHTTFPSPKYRDDPVSFFREVLGVEPWDKQIQIINAVRDHPRVAVKSGHKISKSHTAAGIALWFFCSFDDARAIMTSTTSRQVDDILWRETRMMRARAGICTHCKRENESRSLVNQIQWPCIHSAEIGGEMGDLARTGLKSEDFREIKGFTAREAEAVAGISGKNLLYILDEASGIRPEIYEAIEGNRAGGARIVMFSNPTKTSGEFYDAFNSKSAFYHCISVSSEETPNVVHGDDDPRAIPGLASRDWVEEKKREWGEGSALYNVRVRGEFSELEEGRIFSIHTISEAEERWAHPTISRSGDPSSRLYLGLDVAGKGDSGDETVWALRRGLRISELIAQRGLSAESILMHTLGICSQNQHNREVPVVVLDREGKIGAEVYGTFTAFLADKDDPPFELVAVRASDRAQRNPIVYDRVRDELAAVYFDWVESGGAIPTDVKLSAEMHAFEWLEQTSGRVKITQKKDVRKDLGRSPDRFDACCLCVWEPLVMRENRPPRKETVPDYDLDVPAMDPYAGI